MNTAYEPAARAIAAALSQSPPDWHRLTAALREVVARERTSEPIVLGRPGKGQPAFRMEGELVGEVRSLCRALLEAAEAEGAAVCPLCQGLDGLA